MLNQISNGKTVIDVDQLLQNGDRGDDYMRIVCISDTHAKTSDIQFDIPMGDILIHAGDFTSCGSSDEVTAFNQWIDQLPHKYKVVIAGNHELTFDSRNNDKHLTVKKKLTNCIYLEDSSVIINGLKFYGSPWQPLFEKPMAFKIPRGQHCLEKWNLIPTDTDILITHVPPMGCNDLSITGDLAGCIDLLETVQNRVQPSYHISGHIHEGYGVCSDGKTIYINASTCTVDGKPLNPPIVFDTCVRNSYM